MTDPNLAVRAAELSEGIDRLSTSVDALRTDQRRLKAVITGLGVMLVAVALLAVVVAFVAADARQASQRAEQANSLAERSARAQQTTCESGNEARRVSRQLWAYVLDLSSKRPGLTAEQHRQIRTFRAYLATVYVDRDCDSGHPTPRPSTAPPSR